jgi:hypothetical protein
MILVLEVLREDKRVAELVPSARSLDLGEPIRITTAIGLPLVV